MTGPSTVHDKPEMAFWRALSLMLEEGKKPVQAVSDGRMTVVADGAVVVERAAAHLGVAPHAVALISFGDPTNPLQGFMLGQRSSQNHRRLGEVTLALYAYRYELPDFHGEARARVVRQLRHELEGGAWSCPGQEGHEAFGPSHAGHNLAADAAFRFYAQETKDAELLALTEEHWRRLAEYLRLAMDDFGNVMTVGPRAWDATKATAKGQPRSGRSAQLDAVAREIWAPAERFHRLHAGLDMIGPRLVRRGLGINFKPGGPLPVTVDPIMIRRTATLASPSTSAVVLTYMTACTNMMNPGPQMAAMSVPSGYVFAVDKRAGLDPFAGFSDAADFKLDNWWARPLADTREWQTPQRGTSAPQKPEDPGPIHAPPEIGPQGLAGELHDSISRLRDIAARRPAARGEILAEAERIEAVVARVAALEVGS